MKMFLIAFRFPNSNNHHYCLGYGYTKEESLRDFLCNAEKIQMIVYKTSCWEIPQNINPFPLTDKKIVEILEVNRPSSDFHYGQMINK